MDLNKIELTKEDGIVKKSIPYIADITKPVITGYCMKCSYPIYNYIDFHCRPVAFTCECKGLINITKAVWTSGYLAQLFYLSKYYFFILINYLKRCFYGY